MSREMKLVSVLPELMKRLFGEAWRAWEVKNPGAVGGDVDFYVQPKATVVVTLTEMDLARCGTNDAKLADTVCRRVRAAQERIVDELDKSVGRPPRIEADKPPPGCCDFCGAPYGLKVKP